jgi:hypothetical protein
MEKMIAKYEAPMVEVIEVKVENGFANSMQYEDWE